MNSSRSQFEDSLKKLVIGRIKKLAIYPNEKLGQHFLIDQDSVDLLTQSVNRGNTVIEIGAGVGQLTEALAKKAGKVISIEIDRRYEPVLTKIARQHPNVQVIFGDALGLRLQNFIPESKSSTDENRGVQIVANLPFHITEPFLHKIISLPIESAALAVGQKLMYAAGAADCESEIFGQLSLLVQTFFEAKIIAAIEKKKFFPVPRTSSAIIRLIPKEEYEFRSNKRDFLLRRLFITANKSLLVKNTLKEGLIEFAQISKKGTLSQKEHNRRLRTSAKIDLKRIIKEYNHSGKIQLAPQRSKDAGINLLTQNQARAVIEKMAIPDSILNKPFEQLNNNELQILSKALR